MDVEALRSKCCGLTCSPDGSSDGVRGEGGERSVQFTVSSQLSKKAARVTGACGLRGREDGARSLTRALASSDCPGMKSRLWPRGSVVRDPRRDQLGSGGDTRKGGLVAARWPRVPSERWRVRYLGKTELHCKETGR